jgi:hypothetical protein
MMDGVAQQALCSEVDAPAGLVTGFRMTGCPNAGPTTQARPLGNAMLTA